MSDIDSALGSRTQEGHLSRQNFNVWSWVRAQVDEASYRPRAAPGIVARRLDEGDAPYYVLKNPHQGTYLKLSEQDYALWGLMDGSRSVKDLVVAYFERYKTFAFGRVSALVDELRNGGFLTDRHVGVYQQAQEQTAEREWSHHWRRLAQAFLEKEFYIEGIDPLVTQAYRVGGRVFFFKPVLGALTLVALAGLVVFGLLLDRQHYAILAPGDSTVWGYLASLLMLLLINSAMIFIHESAHALTTKHFGREVRRGGVMIYYGMPAFFVDTADIWMEPKGRRMAVSWAGLHAELIVAGICSLLVYWIGDPGSLAGSLLFKAAFLGYLSLFFNLNPLLELDGYFILSDWLSMPMLRQRSFAFIRQELPGKVSALLRRFPARPVADQASRVSPATRGETIFAQEEIIFTIYGMLAALYTLYALWIAVYFWQTRISSFLLDLWNTEPALIFKPLVTLLLALVIVPAVLVLGATFWHGAQRLADWLEQHDFFERERNVAATAAGGLCLALLLPVLVGGTLQQFTLAIMPVLLAGVAVWTLVLTARQYAGAEFQTTFWGLALAAGLLLVGSFLRGLSLTLTAGQSPSSFINAARLAEQLAAVGLLVAGIRSLAGVGLRRSPAWEQVVMLGLLGLGLVLILPLARWTVNGRALEVILAIASACFSLVFLACIVPTLTAYVSTRFFVSWVTLVLGAAALGVLTAARAAPGWPAGLVADNWMQLTVAALWGLGGLTYATAGARIHFPVSHWSHSLAFSDQERLRVAFARFFETLFRGFWVAFGARRAQQVGDELRIDSAGAEWGIEFQAGRVRDDLDLSQMSILQQGDRYREVLARSIDLVDNWAGSLLAARLAQAAYDSLPWPERETLGHYVLEGTSWGGAIADEFVSARDERDRLLRRVPFLARLGRRDFYLLQAALEYERLPAGHVLARRRTPIDRFVLVQSGEIEVWQADPSGESERLAGALRRGASFGSEVFLGQATHQATYRASIDTEILTISAIEAARLRQAGVEIDTQVVGALTTAQLLSQMPIFADLSRQQVDALAARMQATSVEPGQIIVQQGEPRHHFYVILKGQVAINVRDASGAERMVGRLGRGEHFGETSLFTDQPYAATCQAETPAELLTLDEATFDQLVASSRQVAHYVEQVSSARTLDTRRKLGLQAIVS